MLSIMVPVTYACVSVLLENYLKIKLIILSFFIKCGAFDDWEQILLNLNLILKQVSNLYCFWLQEILRFQLGELESELRAKEEERLGFMQCFENLESEKMNLANKISELRNDFENLRKERDDLKTSLVLSNDTLVIFWNSFFCNQ